MNQLYLKRMPEGDGKYLFINVLARRARELNRDTRNTADFDAGSFDPIGIAGSEFDAGKITFEYRSGPVEEEETVEAPARH